ncbi:MAG TPA: hypothetical protein VGK19_24905 [Capsulimonadaceae bacterium]|jgi:hypothetical protein
MSIRTSAMVDDMSTQLVIRIAKPPSGGMSFDRRPRLNKKLGKIARNLRKLTVTFKTPTDVREQIEAAKLVDSMRWNLNTIMRSVGGRARDAAELERLVADPGPTDVEYDEIEKELNDLAVPETGVDSKTPSVLDDLSDLEALLELDIFNPDLTRKKPEDESGESGEFPDLEK